MSAAKAKRVRAKSLESDKLDLNEILGTFTEAMAFIEVAVNSLDGESGRGGAELHVVLHGLLVLKKACNQLEQVLIEQDS
jgi:hypothetical protein